MVFLVTQKKSRKVSKENLVEEIASFQRRER